MRAVSIALAVIVVLALGVWQLWERVLGGEAPPEAALAAENALAVPSLIGLATLDLARVSALGAEPDGLLEPFGLAGARVSHAVLAVTSAADARPALALGLAGAFDPAALEASLKARKDMRVREAEVAGERVLFAARVDPDRCGDRDDWALLVQPDRLLLAEPALFEILVPRWRSAAPAAVDLSGLRETRGSAPASLAWFVPAELPVDGVQPFVAAALERGHSALADVSAAYLTVRAGPFGLWPKIEVRLEARERARVAAELRGWLAAQAAEREQWARFAPALATLLDESAVEDADGALVVTTTLDTAWLRDVRSLASQILIAASRGLRSPDPAADHVELAPGSFRASYRPSDLPDYRPETPLAGPVDAESGPFGVRVRAARLSELREAGFEVEVEAVAPALRMLGERAAGPFLEIETARDEDGAELLREEPCGPDRNGRPAPLTGDVGSDLIRARKAVRLKRDVELDRVSSLRGKIDFDLPVRTESVRIEAPTIGASVERPGARVEITGLSDSAFSYRITGAPEQVLAVRALNPVARPLAPLDSWFVELPGTGELIAAETYRGELAEFEVVFALEQQPQSFPFELASARPGSSGEEPAAESAAFIEYSEQQFEQEFGPRFGQPIDPERPGQALGTAGPFTLVLRELGHEGRVAPRIGVLAPDIPNLTYNLHGLELELDSVLLQDGQVAKAGVRVPVLPHRSFGRDELVSDVALETPIEQPIDAVRGVAGTVRLNLAQGVRSVRVEPVDPGQRIEASGVILEVRELGRDRLALLLEGDVQRLVAVRAYNAEGAEILVEDVAIEPVEEGARLAMTVRGVASAIDVQLSTGARRFAYDFRLELPAPVPAAAAP